MTTRTTLLVIAILGVALPAAAAERPRLTSDPNPTIHGAAVGEAKSGRDTTLLMGPTGSGAPYIGDFESGAKALAPAVNGWTSVDNTQRTGSRWHVSTYRAVAGAYSALCGDETLPSCDGGVADPDGGYGNDWHELLEWRQTVDDPGVATTLTITALANVDSEAGYDGTALEAEKTGTGFVEIAYWDGRQDALAISETVTYQPGEYVGDGGDEVVLVWRFRSDGGWSDEDCSYPTAGAIQLDDVLIASDNGPGTGGVVDFEDQTLGPFTTPVPQGVGDFARIWSWLEDIDPCRTNYSHQVAFIDDGMVVPGTGGSDCDTWCYGPNGKIVNTTGGLAGPEHHLDNSVLSPVMDWPDAAHDGALLSFDHYQHEDLSADAPGIFWTWDVRSADLDRGQDIATQPWRSRDFYLYGLLGYARRAEILDGLLEPGRDQVQVRLTVHEIGWVWGWNGDDGYPAPYFDNVRVQTYPVAGPALSTREIDLAQDGFPESGTVETAQPGALWVRFDMAQDISAPNHPQRDFGDSVVFDCAPTRADAVLDGPPRLHYQVTANPVFDPYRSDPTPHAGSVACGQVTNAVGEVVPDRWFADLPDSGWIYPGDVVRYYFAATDRDTVTGALETALLPADTTGFFNRWDPMAYPPSFTLRALPTLRDLGGTQPEILFWNDSGDRGGRDEWYSSFWSLPMAIGRDYDVYSTNSPSSGVGNGLGGRSVAEQLAGYEVLLYTSGDLGSHTLSNGDRFHDSGDDVQVLTAWLDGGGKGAFLTGDDLASDLAGAGAAGAGFLGSMMNVAVVSNDVRPFIDNQHAPRVLAAPSNPVFTTVSSWVAYGGCPAINTYDAVTTTGVGQRLAIFANVMGDDGLYPYSAATLAAGVGTAGTSEVISLPYDFSFLHTDPREGAKANATLAARTRVLSDVLWRWGQSFMGFPADVPDAAAPLSARCEPNPFNPTTTIRYHAPRAGRLVLKVFDVRGALVRTLVDGQVAEGAGQAEWSGKDDRGRGVASGVYFYQVRMGGEVRVGKMTLIK